MAKQMTVADANKTLEMIYKQALNGIPKVSKPIDVLADEYLERYGNPRIACKKMMNNQIKKCTTTGFVTGLGGMITLPAAISADVGGNLYVQMRMIACAAHMGGLNLKSDEVQTMVYACFVGISVQNMMTAAGIKFGEKFTTQMIAKVPGSVLTKINQAVGFRFITKFGQTGIVNLGKMVPVVGGLVGGGFDYVQTKAIANRAYKQFILNDFSEPQKKKLSLGRKGKNNNERREVTQKYAVAVNGNQADISVEDDIIDETEDFLETDADTEVDSIDFDEV